MSYLQFGIGLGFVMAMVMGLMALDVDATSIEYYATVAEPMCELNYAKFGLGYYDVVEGFGDEAPLGELIIIHYTGIFGDGIVFDSSYKRGRPLTMRIEVGKIKCYMQQLLRGLEHCHSRAISRAAFNKACSYLAGKPIMPGRTEIHYTVRFGNGIVFDSSYKRGRPLTMRIGVGKIKCYMQQLLRGLAHCHSRGVMNGDIKGSNLLLDNNGNVKIADFGLATHFQPSQGQPLTRRVVTLPGSL
ncbi:hypothetical protein TSUD_371420 [Trifolium subterraneum]|uniref:peptidylprolyl isomerase n=1 Tax=Trifolium subterraneum TaxID=3900 RepID=A0A2Z6NQB7_TRISU|nr:hypothetical protein TSUD_371420 [Trifolium subterraneum]